MRSWNTHTGSGGGAPHSIAQISPSPPQLGLYNYGGSIPPQQQQQLQHHGQPKRTAWAEDGPGGGPAKHDDVGHVDQGEGCFVGLARTIQCIYSVYTVFLAGKAPYFMYVIYGVFIYGSGQPYCFGVRVG